ncbi:peptidase S8 and S53 subtilisin kexin sedolisin [Chloroherpeton thalassium ATCC 35110]|uniref:Peptidase S8 and S53 subtilisin kexin sedolisin n=1 Tax=Chloroherpeton thalassium (strain ATCC 35110 / GB-78) TaxID=517418 RepID=B3QT82_CHLT3|nr:S8 family serine peptidase [Chloroherpeton thalassium]ACF14181.1 peptidase S8 and S53 subtilisin kexin sedolisin [Chloroherpeton thalassium ATCC 35110]
MQRVIFITILFLFGQIALVGAQPAALKFKRAGKPAQLTSERLPQGALAGFFVKFKSSAGASAFVKSSTKNSAQTSASTLGFSTEWLFKTSDAAKNSVQAEASGLTRTLYFRPDSSVSQKTADSLFQSFSARADVEIAELNHFYELHDDWTTPNDSAYSSQWNLEIIEAAGAWEITKGSSDVKVGIVDTGIDYTHPDLIPNLFINPEEDINGNGTFEPWSNDELRNPETLELDASGIFGDFDDEDQDGNGYADDVIGWDFTDQPLAIDALNGTSDYETPDADPFDENSHGTACAGIVAAATNNAKGVAGIAPDCKLVALRVFTASGYSDDKDIASAILYAAENDIQVLNMSFGDVTLSTVVRDAVQYAYAQGVVMCASAGNDGTDEQHYPSSFDEVISIVATTQADQLAYFSSYGLTVDLGAPGSGCPTTLPYYDGNYTDSFAGTSAAAPHAAGAAALILSLHPEYTPKQVRGLLVSTADDIASEGWDHYTGGGRLNIERAVNAVGAPVVEIQSPVYESGFSDEETIAIVGTVTSPEFESYEVLFRVGDENEGDWQIIQAETAYQKISDTLAVWPISALADTIYTLRVVVNETSGGTIETRARYFIDRTAPVISDYRANDAILDDQHGVLIEFHADDLVSATLFYRLLGNSGSYSQVAFSQVKRTQSAFLTETELQGDLDYEAYIECTNLSGLKSKTDLDTLQRNSEVVLPPTYGENVFQLRSDLSLSKGYFYNASFDFNQNGKPEILMNEGKPLEGLKYGPLKWFEYQASETKFSVLDSVDLKLIVRSVEDLDGDGKSEVLTQSGTRTIVYSQTAVGSSPFSKTLYDNANDATLGYFWGSRIADTKGTGDMQILGRNDTAYFVLDENFNRIAMLPNPVKKGKDGYTPAFEEPKSLVQDFDEDGLPEILVGDYDANFYIYEYSGSGNIYNQTWLERTRFIGGSNSLAEGDFLGNGKKQFVVAAHSDNNQNDDREYAAPVWMYQCWQATGDDTYEKVWEQLFYNYKPAYYFESATSAGDVDGDGQDELLILTYPNLYVFKWDDAEKTFKAIWHYPMSSASELIVADIDGNGLNEIYFADDLTALVYEYQNYDGVLAPVGVDAEPLGETSVELSWLSVDGAEKYRVYRDVYDENADTKPTTLLLETAGTGITDADLTSENKYIYAVTAISGTSESDTSFYAVAWPHALPCLDSAAYSEKMLTLDFSEPLNAHLLNAAYFQIRQSDSVVAYPSSVSLTNGGARAVMSFKSAPLGEGNYTILVKNVRDIYNAQIDTLHDELAFQVEQESEARFYITSREVLSSQQIKISFNRQISPTSAADLTNYSLSPYGSISAAAVDNTSNTLTLTLSGNSVGSLGYTVSLEILSLQSLDGIEIDKTSGGNVISFSNSKSDLSDAFTYPNPYRVRTGNGFIMFANLTDRATIDIYTLNGKHIRRIEHENETGGTKWLLDTKSGERVASGIYIYRITADGGKEKMGKLAIVR